MAWTNPRTWTQSLVTVDDLNTHVRDNLNYLFRPTHNRFRVRTTSAQSVATETWTKVALATEDNDPSALFDNSTYRLWPIGTGTLWFHVSASMFISNATGRFRVALYKNGVERAGAVAGADAGSGFDSALHLSDLVDFNGSTDYIELYAEHRSGSSRNITGMMSGFFVGGS